MDNPYESPTHTPAWNASLPLRGRWLVDINQVTYRIELYHSHLNGAAELWVEGEFIYQRPAPPLWMDFGLRHDFQIEDQALRVKLSVWFLWFRYRLYLNGEQVD